LAGVTTLTSLKRDRIKVLPPVKRGDVDKLISARLPATMAIVDGQFQQCLSVGHAEIRSALARGWQVWGLSSMGAIRAYEMRHMGVHGYGRVYQCFLDQVDFRDDEVALLHELSPPYRALSEPLIHLRLWLKELRSLGLINGREEKLLVRSFMTLWFGERTLARARTAVLNLIPDEVDKVDETLTNFDRFRVKTHDLRDFLRDRPWTTPPGS
jgi:hypothetical protein